MIRIVIEKVHILVRIVYNILCLTHYSETIDIKPVSVIMKTNLPGLLPASTATVLFASVAVLSEVPCTSP